MPLSFDLLSNRAAVVRSLHTISLHLAGAPGVRLSLFRLSDDFIDKKGKTMSFKKLAAVSVVLTAFALSGCGAMTTAVKKRNLEVKTQMSETVWLEPSSEKTVYIQVKNTSDKDMSNLQTLIANDLSAKGYKVTSSPDTLTTGCRLTC